MKREALEKYAYCLQAKGVDENGSVLGIDCDIIEYLFDNCEITIPEENRFFVNVNCDGIQREVFALRAAKYKKVIVNGNLYEGYSALAYTGEYDFGHTSAAWENIIPSGIFGLREKAAEYSERFADNKEKYHFYSSVKRVYDAAIRFMARAADLADSLGKSEMADGLRHLSSGEPQNLYEAMQTSLVYYAMQQWFEGTNLRTLGRIDSLFYPFYKKENKDKARVLIRDYLKEINRFKVLANIPFALGGSDVFGNCLINELSYEIINAYKELNLPDTKFHIFAPKNIPDDIIDLAFECIREGKNSIVFLSDEKVIESLEKIGAERKDAVGYHVVGCYECGAEGELTCSCNARVNIPKALELALNGGCDMLTGKKIGLTPIAKIDDYDSLFAEFSHQLSYLCECAVACTDIYEEHYNELHSAPIMSCTYKSSFESAKDLYCQNGAKYPNSSLNALGLATAADSLSAIKKIVFEDERLTLDEMVEVLRSDWQGEEVLRLFIKNRLPKYGMKDKFVDSVAKSIVDVLETSVNGIENKKGGKYRLGLFSIDWRWNFGKKSAASADGRKAGEPLSQNSGASFGADREGATAVLASVASIDTSRTPNGTIVDIDLHSSAVRGENGKNALRAMLKSYFELGGFAVHYNVLNTEILEDARKYPDKYPTLQVRLCGWNALFSSLTDKEKDEFILRSKR